MKNVRQGDLYCNMMLASMIAIRASLESQMYIIQNTYVAQRSLQTFELIKSEHYPPVG